MTLSKFFFNSQWTVFSLQHSAWATGAIAATGALLAVLLNPSRCRLGVAPVFESVLTSPGPMSAQAISKSRAATVYACTVA